MKPTCPSCQNKINSTDIINTNKKGIFIESNALLALNGLV